METAEKFSFRHFDQLPTRSSNSTSCLSRKRKSHEQNEHSQEKDGIEGFQDNDKCDNQEDDTDDSQYEYIRDSQEDGPNVKYSKNDLSDILCGTHETQMSEGGEADLHKQLVGCKKNPGHTQFVSVNDFNISHLPEGCHDNLLVEYIKAIADLTVRVAVTMTSTERPEFWPNTKKPYAFYDKRGSGVLRVGTGTVRTATTENNEGTCPCHKCQHAVTPSKVWGRVKVYTATHVVFDNLEAKNTTCRLFFDRQDSPLVTLDGWAAIVKNIDEDRCNLTCVTCDVYLMEKLKKMTKHWYDLWMKVNNKYYRSGFKLTLIVSHPHGCPKHISIGHWIDRYEVNDNSTKYTYTTCTCPGSSGAFVQPLEYGDYFCYNRHVHSGVNSEGSNFSGTGWELCYF